MTKKKTVVEEAPKKRDVRDDYCDGCCNLIELGTLGGHKKCTTYNRVLLPNDSVYLTSSGIGKILRPSTCKGKIYG